MKRVRQYLRFMLVLAFSAALVLGSATLLHSAPRVGGAAPPELSYSVSGCDETQAANPIRGAYPAKKIGVSVDSGNLQFSHALSYVCCAEIRLESRIEGNTIAITEVNEGDYCRCMCDYSIEGTFGPLEAGTYNLKLYGVEYRPPSGSYSIPPRLLFQTQAIVS